MRHKYLAGLFCIAALAAPVRPQSVKAGTEAWARGEYAAAVANWRPLAAKGDADAQFNLGQAYRWGRGVPINLAEAQGWYERAAQKGQVNAQFILGGLLYENGNRVAGLRWMKAASEQGEPRAMLIYGRALFNGDGVSQDPVRGYAYVKRAAAQNVPMARETLAEMDHILPAEERKKGAALALANAKASPAPKAKPSARKPVRGGAVHVAEAVPAKPAPKPAASPASGAWRIQLGAFSQRASAEALFRKLSGNAALSGRHAYYIPAGAITRLQVGPFASKSAAAAACRSVGQACFPVAGK
jgi:TPR repeat protein